MPIYDLKNDCQIPIEYEDSIQNIAVNSRVARFGTGDILVAKAREVGKPFFDEIALLQRTPHEIGERATNDPENLVVAPIRLIFDKPESVQVFIDELIDLKQGMISQNS